MHDSYEFPVTVIIVNFRTRELIERAAVSLLNAYPKLPIVLVDNGSEDASTDFMDHLSHTHEFVTAILHESNLYHGPAMHHAMGYVKTPYAMTMDSDCEVRRTGFLEPMLAAFSNDPTLYAVGRLSPRNRFGYHTRPRRAYVRYIDPLAMLIDRAKYEILPPFIHHGAPCIHNMKGVEKHGFTVQHFPVEDYIYHAGRGTCGKHGYGLGIRARFEYILNWPNHIREACFARHNSP